MMRLMEEEVFAFDAAGSLLSLLQLSHTNLHESDYVQLFKLLDLLNTLQYVRCVELHNKLDAVMA
jgi:hypothetical protein